MTFKQNNDKIYLCGLNKKLVNQREIKNLFTVNRNWPFYVVLFPPSHWTHSSSIVDIFTKKRVDVISNISRD